MTEAKVAVAYTPGPWYVDPDDWNGPREEAISIKDRPTDTFIAHAWSDFEADADDSFIDGIAPHGTALANAHLIAAAPEMLAALQSVALSPNCVCTGEHNARTCDCVGSVVRAVIAKAKGQ